jgi:tetratricopeptide (TPR) repeat protein/2-polyprenyl-3-methyl-5-hydroxy-6-metoxy-1,4-benzoquinol methylase
MFFRKPAAATAGEGQSVVAANSAMRMIDEGNALEEQGLIPEAMARYEAAIQADPRCARAHLNRGNIFLMGAKLEEARGEYLLAIACDPNYAAAHFNLGNLNSAAGEFELALRNFQAAVGFKSDFSAAYVAMGNALDSLGRTAEAVESYQRALAIDPAYAEVHFNLGVIAVARGRHDEAVMSLLRAVELKPDYAEARDILGIELRRIEDPDVAEACYRRAFAFEPKSERILYELSILLRDRGKAHEALPLLIPALEPAPSWTIKLAFASCVARTNFTADDSRIRAALESALLEPWGMPSQLCRPALGLVMLDRRIADCVHLANASWPERLPKSTLFGADGLAALGDDSLLHAMLKTAPVSTFEIERFLTGARHALLAAATRKQAPDPSDLAALRFYAALSQQCFVNEYIFDYDDKEKLAVEACRTQLQGLLDANAAVPPLLLLAVAAYLPLYTLRNASRLLDVSFPKPIDEVLRQQIREPLEEQALRSGIKRLTTISAGVSEEVRSQYEQNPYPRWVKLQKKDDSPNFNDALRGTFPLASFTPLRDDNAPEALYAGCGTGSHAIFTAQRFRGVRVLAIDLSLSSISYAKRKTQELGITSIEYAQADILKLGEIARTFDIIQSAGVLHHMADPFAGWRTLLSLLRPGGFMFLGFYSELSRKQVVKAREIIAARGYLSTPEDIRRFRQYLASGNADVDLQILSQGQDFFTTSECRDLLFHVQEHRLTLAQIETFLAEFGLRFIGFEVDRNVLNQYRARFPDDPACADLRNWASFESDNPNSFAAMYQFWIQKPLADQPSG